MKKTFYLNGRLYKKSRFELGTEKLSSYMLVFGLAFFAFIAFRLIFKL